MKCVCVRGTGGDVVPLEAEWTDTSLVVGERVISSSRRRGKMLEIWKSIGKRRLRRGHGGECH